MNGLPVSEVQHMIMTLQKYNNTKYGEKVKILENALVKIKQYQDSAVFQVEFEKVVKELRQTFYLIPTVQKKPVAKFESEEDKEKANQKQIGTEAGLLIPEWLKVIDIDNPELFCSVYEIQVEKLEEIATIKTGKGYHIYAFDLENTIQFCNTYLLTEGWETRVGINKYIMFAGSRFFHPDLGRNVFYQVINPKIYSTEELPEELKKIIKKTGKGNGNGTDETEIKEKREFEKYTGTVNLKQFKELLLNYYVKGNRQNLCIYAAGFLLHHNIDKDTVTQFFEEFLDEVDDNEKKNENGRNKAHPDRL